MRRIAVALAALTVALTLAGCSTEETPAAPTADCDAAFASASIAMNGHYATHPYFGSEYDALYADGTITAEEQVALDAMTADEQAQFTALIDPIYDNCTGVQDLYAGGFAHRDDADWALRDVKVMSRAEIKSEFVVSHCYRNEERLACSDFVADAWR